MKKEDTTYLQSNDGEIYKVMSTHLLKMSPWQDGEDRRLHEYDTEGMHVISYQNACMIVNKQFNEVDEKWAYDGKHYIARRQREDVTLVEHIGLLKMLPSHAVKDMSKMMRSMPDGYEISFKDDLKNELKMIKHKGKVYYMMLIERCYPKVPLYDMFFNFCQWVNVKNVKPIFCETDETYI